MFEHIHAAQWIVHKVAHEDTYCPSMHANENGPFFTLLHDIIDRRRHSNNDVIRTLSALNAQGGISTLPFLEHVVIVRVFLRRHPISFFRPPTNFVKADQRGMWYTPVDKLLNGLVAASKGGCINVIEADVLIRRKKGRSLLAAIVIQIRINTTSLHDASKVEIGLAMTYKVNFFGDQFCAILGPPGVCSEADAQAGAKITDWTNTGVVLMGIFRNDITLEALNSLSRNTMAEQLGIQFTAIGDDTIEATMPVDHRTLQPFGLLHGGASVALAETLGSVAAQCCVDAGRQFCVGLDINANHLRGVRSGLVKGITRPVHIGKKTQVWEIRISNENNELVCISRITMAVLEKQS